MLAAGDQFDPSCGPDRVSRCRRHWGVSGRGAQENVADHITRPINSTTLPDQPSFFYHLGDVVYFNGEDVNYHDQFYHLCQDLKNHQLLT